ncbi:MAG: type I-E CRISPR-associated protein Cse2/CasB [Chlorobium sp.]|nr:type I-E CRISPR-associated protein Cse2/CasB [Chlorobium sp.]
MSTFLERLRMYKEDRGMMANLRCILVENKKHRAWPVLNRLGLAIGNKYHQKVTAYVAGLYATHPEEAVLGNFGATCKAIERERKEKRSDDNKLTPTERRFQHLLAAGNEEVLERIMRMVMMAKSHGVPVNYEQLEKDLRYWSDRTKSEWAASFWTTGATLIEEDL